MAETITTVLSYTAFWFVVALLLDFVYHKKIEPREPAKLIRAAHEFNAITAGIWLALLPLTTFVMGVCYWLQAEELICAIFIAVSMVLIYTKFRSTPTEG